MTQRADNMHLLELADAVLKACQCCLEIQAEGHAPLWQQMVYRCWLRLQCEHQAKQQVERRCRPQPIRK